MAIYESGLSQSQQQFNQLQTHFEITRLEEDFKSKHMAMEFTDLPGTLGQQ